MGLRSELLSIFVGKLKILNQLSVHFSQGEIWVFIGSNGAGKTTALKALGGLSESKSMSGKVYLKNVDLYSLRPEIRAKKVLYLGANLNSDFPLSVKEVVASGGLIARSVFSFSDNESKIDQSLETAGVSEFKNRIYFTLSSGEKQRVAFARALFQDPEVLLLDESFSQVDIRFLPVLADVVKRLSENGKIIIIASHDFEWVKNVSTHGLFLQKGNIKYSGNISEIWKEEHFQECFESKRVTVKNRPSVGWDLP